MRNLIYTLLLILTLNACKSTGEEVNKEEWANRQVSEWPEIVFTNDIEFKDTSYTGLGNSFLVDAFNTLKSRDWLLFEVNDIPAGFTPLKIRTKPLQEDEIIYCLGWPYKQKEGSPSLVKMQVFRNAGPYYYINTLSENVDPAGRSGSPVIDANGYLVGIVSGAEGNLGVIGNVNYLDEFIK